MQENQQKNDEEKPLTKKDLVDLLGKGLLIGVAGVLLGALVYALWNADNDYNRLRKQVEKTSKLWNK